MDKQVDTHPSQYMVIYYNEGEDLAKSEYFMEEKNAVLIYGEKKMLFDNVYIYKMQECKESPPPKNK